MGNQNNNNNDNNQNNNNNNQNNNNNNNQNNNNNRRVQNGYGYYDEEDNELWFCDDFWEPPEEIDYKEFAECTRVDFEAYDDGGENVELFIGPSCASDEISITLDVYYDEFCSVSASDVYSPSDLIEDFDQYAFLNYIDTD